jgi:hypothetical protein
MPFSKTALGSPRQNWQVLRTGKSTNQATEATRKAASLLQIDFLIVLKCPFPEATPSQSILADFRATLRLNECSPFASKIN